MTNLANVFDKLFRNDYIEVIGRKETEMNAVKISKELATSFPRARALKSRIKGFRRTSTGFSVKQLSDSVLVYWENEVFNKTNRLDEILTFLIAKGYQVVDQENQLKVIA